MTFKEFIELYRVGGTSKEITNAFNSLTISDRKAVLNLLGETRSDALVKTLRNQAVKDFWTHEQELINACLTTR